MGYMTIRSRFFDSSLPNDTPYDDDDPDRSVYLVVIDDTQEMLLALQYACLKASAVGGNIAFLVILPPVEYSYFAKVQKNLQDENIRHVQTQLDVLCREVERHGLMTTPHRFIRQGNVLDVITDVIAQIPCARGLVLATSGASDSPGPILTKLLKGGANRIDVPIHIIPGHFSSEHLDTFIEKPISISR